MKNSYDALILIHPEMPPPYELEGNPDYLSNLIRRVNNFLDEKPVFWLPIYPHSLDLEYGFLKRTILIPTSSPFPTKLTEEEIQFQVDFISGVIGKKARDIRVCVGGTALHYCVINFLVRWCSHITNYVVERYFPVRRKLGSATILFDITDIYKSHNESTII